jgi:hypothetical protein
MQLPIIETADLRLELNVHINFTFDFSKNDRNGTVTRSVTTAPHFSLLASLKFCVSANSYLVSTLQ